MTVISAELPDVLIIEPQVFGDERSFFLESFNQIGFAEKTGLNVHFVQDNHSRSVRNVLRGLHYQILQPQGKLVRVVVGAVLDVAVDIRRGSPTFGKWGSCLLSADNKRQLWVPPGMAHGFLVVSDVADVLYETTDYYAPHHERTLWWDDPDLAIAWNLGAPPILSAKDEAAALFRDAEAQIKSLVRKFRTKTIESLNKTIEIAISLIYFRFLNHWFTKCCCCT